MNIGIAGLGVIGGSLAKAISDKTKGHILTAFDTDRNAVEAALEEKVISRGSFEREDILKDCEIIFLCLPVNLITGFMGKTANINAVFTDVGSTKVQIMKSIPNHIRFVGGHPLTGSEKTGYQGSNASLFENAAYVLCKGENATEDDLKKIRLLVESMGAIPLEMTAEEHDKTVAHISHIPHIAAAALVNIVSDLEDKTAEKLCAGGFKDITRIASSSAELWRGILFSGGEAVIEALDSYIKELEKIRNHLIQKDDEKITQDLFKAKVFRDGITDNIGGLLPSVHEIWVEVPDKPGIIGTVAADLGNEQINIKNISIQNNRDFEGGCLRIGLGSERDAKTAVEHLTLKGYSAGVKK